MKTIAFATLAFLASFSVVQAQDVYGKGTMRAIDVAKTVAPKSTFSLKLGPGSVYEGAGSIESSGTRRETLHR